MHAIITRNYDIMIYCRGLELQCYGV